MTDSTKKEMDDILKYGKRFCYMMLSRLQSDCAYFLGNGNCYEPHLWAGNVPDHIDLMRGIWENAFTDSEKPEWLTLEQIEQYRADMMAGLEKKTQGQGKPFKYAS